MFIKIIFGYILGYLKITVEGYYIERFINICKNNKIAIWNLKRDKDVKLKLKIRIKDFKEICYIAKKLKCKVKIVEKRGVPFILQRYKKRKIFFILLVLFITFIMISSIFVWNVDIIMEDEEKIQDVSKEIQSIANDIEEAGLKIGKAKRNIDTKKIINEVRLKRKDIAWMGIELKGTNAIVKVVKADEKPDIIQEDDYCNIVANKAGIITKINAQEGTANVKVGDTINQGDVLVKGYMEGKYTGIRYVHAKADIEAKVWYTKHKTVDYNTTERRETGNVENKYAVKFNNFEINLNKRLSKFEIYDTISAENKIKLFSDLYLPISIIKTTNKEMVEEQKKYNMEEAKSIGIEELQKELDSLIEAKDKIVNKIINTYENENSIDIYVTYEVLENIGTNEKIVF